MEAFSGGRVSVNWMKLVPFLQHCGLDQARGRAAKCKVTGYTFGKVAICVLTCTVLLESKSNHCMVWLVQHLHQGSAVISTNPAIHAQGETRFYCAIGSKSKSFLTLPAAHGVLAPVLEQAGREFKLTGFQVRHLERWLLHSAHHGLQGACTPKK